MTARRPKARSSQRGTTAVEFALIATVAISLMLGVLQFGWILFTFNSAAEATRAGARLAVVSVPNSAAILREMQFFLPGLQASNVIVQYEPSEVACEYVVVQLATGRNAYQVSWVFWPPLTGITVPPFPTSLPRESLGSG